MANTDGIISKSFKCIAMKSIHFISKPSDLGALCAGSLILICSEDYFSNEEWGQRFVVICPSGVIFTGNQAELAHDQFDKLIVEKHAPLIMTIWFNDCAEGLDEFLNVYAHTIECGSDLVVIDPCFKLQKLIERMN